MKTHIILPAIASLALFAANPVWASTSAGNAPQGGAKVENSTGVVFAQLSPARYECREFANYHARQYCYDINGLPMHARHPQ
jgi:hypothetical protein